MPASDTMAGKLRDLIAAVVTESGFDLEELIEQRIGSRVLLRVVVDGEEGISLDDIALVSQAVSAALDEAEAKEPECSASTRTTWSSARPGSAAR